MSGVAVNANPNQTPLTESNLLRVGLAIQAREDHREREGPHDVVQTTQFAAALGEGIVVDSVGHGGAASQWGHSRLGCVGLRP